MIKYVVIGIAIIVMLFIGVNIASALSNSFADQIRDLPIGDQLTLFAQKVDELEQKTQTLEQNLIITQQQLQTEQNKNATTQAEIVELNINIQQQISCQQLIRQTPDRGDGQYVGINIIKFYESANSRLARFIAENNNDEIKFWESIVLEAKPMYDNYIKDCP